MNKKESGGREGNQEKRHANKASSTTQTQRRHVSSACAKVTYRWTGIYPMLSNNGKLYKCKHSHAQRYSPPTRYQRMPKTPETIAPSR